MSGSARAAINCVQQDEMLGSEFTTYQLKYVIYSSLNYSTSYDRGMALNNDLLFTSLVTEWH
jgi:hypothetical protein